MEAMVLGKSTLLNIIAEKMKIERTSNFKTEEQFMTYVHICDKVINPLQSKSKLISSEDVFSHILNIRLTNMDIDKKREELEKEYENAKYSSIDFENIDTLSIQNEARKSSRNKFINKRLENNIKQLSNGETALEYFNNTFEENGLYILDEPENSLAPKFQIKLAKYILECARFYNCQFIIASHSPFILSIKDALIYHLDNIFTKTKKWDELENMKIYYEFFKDYEDKFKNNCN